MSGGASACRTAKRLGEAAGLRVGDSAPISEEPSGNWRKEPKLSGGGRRFPKGHLALFAPGPQGGQSFLTVYYSTAHDYTL